MTRNASAEASVVTIVATVAAVDVAMAAAPLKRRVVTVVRTVVPPAHPAVVAVILRPQRRLRCRTHRARRRAIVRSADPIVATADSIAVRRTASAPAAPAAKAAPEVIVRSVVRVRISAARAGIVRRASRAATAARVSAAAVRCRTTVRT